MIITFFSPRGRIRKLFCCSLLLIFSLPSHAADKPQTLTGTITLGAGRFALNTRDGKVITFMGKGGNKVFSKCRNGDRCEITGTVVYNTRIPLFITVDKVRKLGHAAAKPATPAAATQEKSASRSGKPAANSNPPPDMQVKDKIADKAEQQPVAEEATQGEQQAPIESPLLPDTPEPPATQTVSPQ